MADWQIRKRYFIDSALASSFQRTSWQHPLVDGFYELGLKGGDIDLPFPYYDHQIRCLWRADFDRKDQRPLAGSGHPQICGPGAYVLLHYRGYLEGKRLFGHRGGMYLQVEIDFISLQKMDCP